MRHTDSRINEFTAMVRPLTPVQTLSSAVLRGLTANGLEHGAGAPLRRPPAGAPVNAPARHRR
ncbi:hypothetical protein GCM10009664_68950 [Kitasatospora gansuensis]